MKNLTWLLLFVSTASALASAQVVDTSVCDVLANPQAFNGKLVRIKGVVAAGFDEFVIKDSSCNQPVNAIWLAYPENSKGKAGAAAIVQLQLAKNSPAVAESATQQPVKLNRNKEFKQFDSLLSESYSAGGMCLGCTRYEVSAALVGRLDGIKSAGTRRDGNGKFIAVNGYGNLNLYRARLVLQSVSDIVPHEIDYSKISSVTTDDSAGESSSGDPVAAAHQAARAFDANSDAYKELESSAAAFGKPGEDNGVYVGFGVTNEASKNEGVKGDADSPDGLLIKCTFNMDRLKGAALERAISHIGTHIADIRDANTSMSSATIYNAEYHAWQTTVLNAMAFQQKTLTAPGGFLLWNSTWPANARAKMVDEGIRALLSEGAGLKAN